LILDGESAPPRAHRFAVRIPDENGKAIDRLSVSRPGPAILRGDTTLFSDPSEIPPRTQASDWIIAEVPQEFTVDDVCDPEAILCHAPDFDSGASTSIGSKPGEVGIPDTGPEAALLFLNHLLEQPNLDQIAQLIDIPKRPITENLVLLAQQSVPALSPRFLAFRSDQVGAAPVGEGEVTYLQMVRNRYLLEDFFCRALCRPRPSRAYTLSFTPLAATPEEARPWSIYRTDVPADEGTGEPEHRQLRFEFNELGEKDHPERSQFVVGYYDRNEPYEFRACLSIDESCTVKVAGSMTVYGDIVRRPPPPPPAGSPGSVDVSQPTLEEALASQPQAPSTLNVTIPVFAPAGGTRWPYEIRIENTGGQTLRTVLALENFAINNGTPSATRIVGGLAELEPGDSADVPVVHTANIPNSVNVAVQITVMAFTPDSKVMYESATASAAVAP
jgi:hypothetical protein